MQDDGRGLHGIELTLRDYVGILFRHKWLVAGVLASVLIASAAWTAVTPSRYESTSAVVLRTNNNQQLFPSVGSSQRTQFVRQPEAELEYVSSSFFSSQAAALSPPGTSVRPRYDSDDRSRSSQISFVASADNAFDAQAAAEAWATFYLTLRATNDIEEVQATIEGSEALIAELEIEKDELLAPIKPIDDALLQETDSDTISRLTTQRLSLRQSLEDELLPVTLQIRTLSQDLSNLRIAAGYVSRPDNSARLSIEPAPGRKVAPRAARNMALATVLGLMAAAGAALLHESFRGVINGASDLSAIAPEIPILAQIPEFARRTEDPLALAADAGTPYAQALERVVSALLYERLVQERQRMSVLVTSSVSGEGKTTVASHLALRLGSTPTSTILLDADLRRPDVHATFGERQMRQGLSHLLQDRARLGPHLRSLAKAPRVRAMFAGAATDNAAALLRQAFPGAVDSLESEYDLLVVDAPPVLAVTDAEVMAHSVDVVVVVVRAGSTSRSQLAETLRKLDAIDARIAGFVLVAVKAKGGYGYTYSNDYQSDPDVQQLMYSPDQLEATLKPSLGRRLPMPTVDKAPDAGPSPAPTPGPSPAPTPAPSPAPTPGPSTRPAGTPARAQKPVQTEAPPQAPQSQVTAQDGTPPQARQGRLPPQTQATGPSERVRRKRSEAQRPKTTANNRSDGTARAKTRRERNANEVDASTSGKAAAAQPRVATSSLWLDGGSPTPGEIRRELSDEDWADPVKLVAPDSDN